MSDWKENATSVLNLCKPEFRWIAMDSDNMWFVFSTKPIRKPFYWTERTTKGRRIPKCLYIPQAPNWEESLIERTQNDE